MRMHAVDSTSIELLGYDAELKVLGVRFRHSPPFYIYKGVPFPVYQGLLNAYSMGAFFNRMVRDRSLSEI